MQQTAFLMARLRQEAVVAEGLAAVALLQEEPTAEAVAAAAPADWTLVAAATAGAEEELASPCSLPIPLLP